MNENTALYQTANQKESKWSLHKWAQHGELMAAGISGILILIGWILKDQSMWSIPLFILAFVIGGFAKAKEGIEETISSKTLNVELLMIFAAIGSALIGYWAEGAILIFIFSLSGALETYTSNKSKKDLTALMSIAPDEATLIEEDGTTIQIAASSLTPGDRIMIKAGERIAADGVIISGRTSVDESALTGESVPQEKGQGEDVFAGTVNLNGSLTVEVTKHNEETLFHKIIKLVESAQESVSPSQAFIEKFEGAYVKGVLITVAILMVLPHFVLGWSMSETFYRAMVFMVVASPCALVASIMPAALSLISNGARNGLLVKGSVFLEKLGTSSMIAFDKTGTITSGKPAVEHVVMTKGQDESAFYQALYQIESQSNHPLAKAISDMAKEHQTERTVHVTIEETSGFGVKAQLNGETWRIGKKDFAGKASIDREIEETGDDLSAQGYTVVYVQKGEEVVGCLGLKDQIRPEAKKMIQELNDLGIQTVMLTGDQQKTAEAIAQEAGIQTVVAECLPDEKVHEVNQLKKQGNSIIMVGDGINDAPALATADVGVAMGGGTDVALETADLILMKNNLNNLTKMIRLSRKMNRIIKQNIIFSLTVICLLICANFLQVLDLPFGVIGHEGSTILVILNGLRLLRAS
ncbi:heavy metal translocating P-type ATPase [Bacillus safensis]|uniref:heavy metal translocating P-type ATPase n=1 Tax=Bacillus safensis TaxID=561879 RepID=UPI00115DEED2|nr:heavy metal translocating P-type ATPase [Bacillus sp. SDF0016]TQR26040.1 heavy metal translocating P-type ATPase [Bacillus sp. SDF0016]